MPAEKVLIVDDERLVRWSLRQKCEEWGYQVVEAPSGEPGLRLAQHESPDLVLLDVRMPDINGIQVLEQIKKAQDAPPPRVGPDYPAVAWAGQHRLHQFPLLVGQQLLPLLHGRSSSANPPHS